MEEQSRSTPSRGVKKVGMEFFVVFYSCVLLFTYFTFLKYKSTGIQRWKGVGGFQNPGNATM